MLRAGHTYTARTAPRARYAAKRAQRGRDPDAGLVGPGPDETAPVDAAHYRYLLSEARLGPAAAQSWGGVQKRGRDQNDHGVTRPAEKVVQKLRPTASRIDSDIVVIVVVTW